MAPDEAQALAALKRVQGLGPEEFEKALHGTIGEPILSIFNALVRAMHPKDSDDDVAKKLHLMMLAYLMAAPTK